MAKLNSPDPIAHSRIYRAILWSAAAAIILAGVYLSQVRFLDAEWLSRAGCLVVMLGIWSSLGSIVQERVLSSRMRWRRRNAIRQAKRRLDAGEYSEQEAEETLQKIDLAFDTRLAELTQSLRLSLGGGRGIPADDRYFPVGFRRLAGELMQAERQQRRIEASPLRITGS